MPRASRRRRDAASELPRFSRRMPPPFDAYFARPLPRHFHTTLHSRRHARPCYQSVTPCRRLPAELMTRLIPPPYTPPYAFTLSRCRCASRAKSCRRHTRCHAADDITPLPAAHAAMPDAAEAARQALSSRLLRHTRSRCVRTPPLMLERMRSEDADAEPRAAAAPRLYDAPRQRCRAVRRAMREKMRAMPGANPAEARTETPRREATPRPIAAAASDAAVAAAAALRCRAAASFFRDSLACAPPGRYERRC